MSDAALRMPARLCGDPRLVSGAKLLGVTKAHFFGSIAHLLCQALDHAEDGDLWRGDGESSARFAAALADWQGDAGEFAHALQQEGWIVEWMIVGWLEYAGDPLYRKYKSRKRERLVEIYAKNGLEYGKGRGDIPEISRGMQMGCFRDVSGIQKKHPLTPITHNPPTLIPSALAETEIQGPIAPNPSAHEKKEMKSPVGGAGGEERPGGNADAEEAGENGASFISFKEGLWERGMALTLDQLDCSGLTHMEVYEAFKPVFVFHSIATLQGFYFRCSKCQCTPAWWTMIYMDKVHAIYRERPDGKIWLEERADPVAMTMAAILPSYGRKHTPSEASRQFFLEIMIDRERNRNGETSRWAGCVTGNLVAKELELRKGRAGKIA